MRKPKADELTVADGDAIIPKLVTTRAFEAADLRAVYAIEEACFAPPLRFSRALMRQLTSDLRCRTWIGVADTIRAGFAIVSLGAGAGDAEALPDTATDSSNAYIWTIEVLPGYRRRGMARQLLERVEESAAEAGCAVIELHVSERNLHARALYVAAGYAYFGMEPQFYGRAEDALRFRKSLGR